MLTPTMYFFLLHCVTLSGLYVSLFIVTKGNSQSRENNVYLLLRFSCVSLWLFSIILYELFNKEIVFDYLKPQQINISVFLSLIS